MSCPKISYEIFSKVVYFFQKLVTKISRSVTCFWEGGKIVLFGLLNTH